MRRRGILHGSGERGGVEAHEDLPHGRRVRDQARVGAVARAGVVLGRLRPRPASGSWWRPATTVLPAIATSVTLATSDVVPSTIAAPPPSPAFAPADSCVEDSRTPRIGMHATFRIRATNIQHGYRTFTTERFRKSPRTLATAGYPVANDRHGNGLCNHGRSTSPRARRSGTRNAATATAKTSRALRTTTESRPWSRRRGAIHRAVAARDADRAVVPAALVPRHRSSGTA